MKNLKKWLALLLAGLLTLTSLTACGGADEEEDEDEEESSEVGYRNLTPEKAYNALLEADDVRVTAKISMESDGEYKELTTTLERDSDKVRIIDTSSSDDKNIRYYDLTKGRYYFGMNEGWNVSFFTSNEWKELTDPDRLLDWNIDLLLDNDNYTKDGNHYIVTEEAIENYIDELNGQLYGSEKLQNKNDLEVEAYTDVEENTCTYVLIINGIEAEENFWSLELTVDFTDTTVEFPDFGIEIEQDEMGVVYELNDEGTYSVIGLGITTGTELVIPSTYKGKPVTKIGDEAIRAEGYITSVVIPSSITSIERSSFNHSTSITSITFENPYGWTLIGNSIDFSDPEENAAYFTGDSGASEPITRS